LTPFLSFPLGLLSQVKRNWLECEVYADYELLPANEIPLDAPSLYELFLWEYMVNAYSRWSQGFEESPEEDQKLEENFGSSFTSSSFFLAFEPFFARRKLSRDRFSEGSRSKIPVLV
jgi:hypothetical protein